MSSHTDVPSPGIPGSREPSPGNARVQPLVQQYAGDDGAGVRAAPTWTGDESANAVPPSQGIVNTTVAATAAPAETAAPALADHSRYVQRIRRRYSKELPLLAPGVPNRSTIEGVIASLLAGGSTLASAMRVTRQLVIERLAVLDVEQQLPMPAVTGAMTHLAEATLEHALRQARADQDARYGTPLTEAGEPIDFWVLGMGKLGARELNVSSDIDLIYVYEDDGHTLGRAGDGTGATVVSAHEYFGQVARSLQTLIGDVTEDGFVFRMDLALRPNGGSGPPAVSLGMLEEYFLVQGREWERFAWLKSRVVAPAASVAAGRALPLRSTVTAFVYRRYLDYSVFESLRQLHRKVREEAQRRAAGRPERANDVKLSRGGIREIEFTVQLLQVVRGGQFPEIRTRSTTKALRKLAEGGLMKAATAQRLAQAYDFLRRVEHRIQYLDDQQTHLLPSNDADLGWIARSLGFSDPDVSCQLLALLGETREFVATEFDALLHDGQAPSPSLSNVNGCKTCGGPAKALDSDEFVDKLPKEIGDRVRRWVDNPRVRVLRDESKLRLAK
ncbi:MAG: glnE, partial [Rhizobacter sp.]|nr:glnE [Rhizobacter sp.]